MKRLLLIIILTLSFQTLTKADDIRDFQIEGISIGDSLLDYMTKKQIINAKKNSDLIYFDKFIGFNIPIKIKNKDLYDKILVTLKQGSDLTIYHISASKNLTNNFNECSEKRKSIVNEVSNLFSKARIVEAPNRKHYADESGKSITNSTYFWLGENFVEVSCYDMDQENPENWIDELRVDITHKDFSNFLINDYYE